MFDKLGGMFGKLMGGGDGGGIMEGLMKDGKIMGFDVLGFATKKLAEPETQKMITEKCVEIHQMVADRFGCTRYEVNFTSGIAAVAVKAIEENGTQVIKMGADGQQLTEDKAVIYIYVKGQPKEKWEVQDFLKQMIPGANSQSQAQPEAEQAKLT